MGGILGIPMEQDLEREAGIGEAGAGHARSTVLGYLGGFL